MAIHDIMAVSHADLDDVVATSYVLEGIDSSRKCVANGIRTTWKEWE